MSVEDKTTNDEEQSASETERKIAEGIVYRAVIEVTGGDPDKIADLGKKLEELIPLDPSE